MEIRRSPFPPIFYKVAGNNIAKTKYKTDKFAAEKTEIQREIYEDDFLEWLNKQNGRKISWKQYVKRCTEANFKKYFAKISSHKKNAIRNKTELVFKKRWEDGHYLGEFKSHKYHVDAIANYIALQRYFEKHNPRAGIIDKDSYLNSLAYELENICNERGLPYKAMVSSGFPLLIPTDDPRFYSHLARKLMLFDVHKIGAVLDWNHAIFKGEGYFPIAIEHAVYDMVNHSSPFDNDIRLEKIMNWVERNRTFASPDAKQKKAEQRQLEPNFHYWPYSLKDLQELYKALLSEQKIEPNGSFVESFKEQAVLIDNPTTWKATQTQLIYLFHLIYKGKAEYKGEPIYKIIPRLFKWIDTDGNEKTLTPNGLNTSYNQIKDSIKNEENLKGGFQTIKSIVEGLSLQ